MKLKMLPRLVSSYFTVHNANWSHWNRTNSSRERLSLIALHEFSDELKAHWKLFRESQAKMMLANTLQTLQRLTNKWRINELPFRFPFEELLEPNKCSQHFFCEKWFSYRHLKSTHKFIFRVDRLGN